MRLTASACASHLEGLNVGEASQLLSNIENSISNVHIVSVSTALTVVDPTCGFCQLDHDHGELITNTIMVASRTILSASGFQMNTSGVRL